MEKERDPSPEEWQTTPLCAASSESERTELTAPRNLKAPPFWNTWGVRRHNHEVIC
jgi:hypothetical protein